MLTTCRISMNGTGRWIDNLSIERLWRSVQYEKVYLHAYREDDREAQYGYGLTLKSATAVRFQQALDYCTPDEVYFGIETAPLVAAQCGYLKEGCAMVFLATTRRGCDDCIALNSAVALWLSATLLTEEEVRHLRSAGRNITTFAHEVRSDDPAVLAEALATIREHHPSESIWVDM